MKKTTCNQAFRQSHILGSFKYLLIFFLFCNIGIAQNKEANELQNIREKVYIHFDKSNYYAGEDIWFKVYLVDAASHKLETASSIVYVDLIDSASKIIETKIISITDDKGAGEFKIPVSIKQGNVTVRAYTNYMRNLDSKFFFTAILPVHSLVEDSGETINGTASSLKPDVQFFPEGGHMVNGFLNMIGFKATDTNGKGIEVQGSIIDDENTPVASLKTMKFGLGKIRFLAKTGRSYYAKVNYNGTEFTYDLPVALDEGILMNVSDRKDHYRISVSSSLNTGIQNLKVTGVQHGTTVCEFVINDTKRTGFVLVPKSTLFNGVAQFTLTLNDSPVCERLVFVDTESPKPTFTITPSNKNYQKRALITLDLALENNADFNDKANLSLAVTDNSIIDAATNVSNIETYLLLKSEIKGAIEQPNYYFDPANADRKQLLDVLLMTQGWRQFLWDQEQVSDASSRFISENGFTLSGSINDYLKKDKKRKALVKLSYMTSGGIAFNEVITDANGKFYFSNLNIPDSTSVFVKAYKLKLDKKGNPIKSKGEPGYFHIDLDSISKPQIELASSAQSTNNNSTGRDLSYLQKLKKNHYLDSINDLVMLDEVVLTTITKKEKVKKERRSLYSNPSNSIDFNDTQFFGENAVSALHGKVPGLRVSSGASTSVTLRGSSPIFLLNGFQVELDAITNISISEIDFVDILKGPKTAVFGPRGVGGVIAFYTKKGALGNTHNKKKMGVLNYIHLKENPIRKFYEPKYDLQSDEQNRFDGRTTISWKPNIQLDEQGKATVSFYAADVSTTYIIKLEGITPEGEIVRSSTAVTID